MKIKHALTLVAAIGLAAPMVANASVCEKLASTVDWHLKRAALDLVRSELYPTNSGPAQLRQQGVTNSMLTVQANLNLMQQNKCSPLKGPLDPYDFFIDASACAVESQAAGGRLDMPKCNMVKWESVPGILRGDADD